MPVVEISYIRKSRLRRAFTATYGGDVDVATCALNLYIHRGWKNIGVKYWHIGCGSARRAAFRFLQSKKLLIWSPEGDEARPTRKLIQFFNQELERL